MEKKKKKKRKQLFQIRILFFSIKFLGFSLEMYVEKFVCGRCVLLKIFNLNKSAFCTPDLITFPMYGLRFYHNYQDNEPIASSVYFPGSIEQTTSVMSKISSQSLIYFLV